MIMMMMMIIVVVVVVMMRAVFCAEKLAGKLPV